MNRHDIVNSLISDPEYKSMCVQIAGDDAEDLYQEIALIILEMPFERVERIDGTCLKCFIYVVARNQYCSKTSPFHKKFRKDAVFIKNHGNDILQLMESSLPDEDLLTKIDRAFNGLYWYDSAILSLYISKGTLKEVSDSTGIPLKSIHHTVMNTRKLLKKKIKRYD